MKITFFCPDELADKIKNEADLKKISQSLLIRVAVENYLNAIEKQKEWLKLALTKS